MSAFAPDSASPSPAQKHRPGETYFFMDKPGGPDAIFESVVRDTPAGRRTRLPDCQLPLRSPFSIRLAARASWGPGQHRMGSLCAEFLVEPAAPADRRARPLRRLPRSGGGPIRKAHDLRGRTLLGNPWRLHLDQPVSASALAGLAGHGDGGLPGNHDHAALVAADRDTRRSAQFHFSDRS